MTKKPPKTKPIKPGIPKSEILNPRQREFCLHYVQLKTERNGQTYGIASEAYRRAGYKGTAGTIGVGAHDLLQIPKIQNYIKQIEGSINFAAHGTSFGRILDAAEVLARISRLASASAIDLLDEKGEFNIDYIREHGLEYLCSAVEIKTTRYPNGTETVTRKYKVEPRKGFLDILANHHGLITGTEEEKIKALGRALTGLANPDHDDILSVITGIPKRLLQSAPLDGPVPKELLETNETAPGKFEIKGSGAGQPPRQ